MTDHENPAIEGEDNNLPTRSGFVALIGPTNAGKSTLVNRLVGAKVSIVSHKVQTTRAVMRGIAIHKNAQIVFMDTPGIFKPRRRLDRAMVTSAWGGAKDADLILLLIDSERGLKGDAEAILEGLKDVPQKKILCLNKIDQVKREDLLKLAAAANETVAFDRTFMISATNGSGCEDLMDYLVEALPEGPWYYPEDQISDLPMRQARCRNHPREAVPAPASGASLCLACRDGKVGRTQGRLGTHRAGDLCRARQPEEDCARQERRRDQGHFHRLAQGTVGNPRTAGASLPVRQGARELG